MGQNPPDSPSDAAAPAAAPAVSVLTARGSRETRPATDIRSHDFRQSGFLAPSELRRIRLRHEQFIRSLAARLAMFLRLEFTVTLAKIQITGFQKFTESLPNPTHITLFKTEPLKGVGLLVIPPRLGLTIVDRLLGGPGQMPAEQHELSEIEIALIDQAATIVLTEWCNHWPEMRDLRPVLLGHENNSRFLQTATPDTAMLVLTLDAGIGEQLEPIQFVFPYATIEPLVRLLCPAGLPEADAAPAPAARLRWNAGFNDMKVPVVAEWQGLKLSAGELARLKTGDVLMLDPQCAAEVRLRLSQVPKFTGRPGTRGGKWAVQLTSPIIPL
ncbi:MAG TPA: FliM/FliN family flagellar motor switch protein [Dongiaceae bacterium]|nr:FliM/FliN family flagellar motor switch protein [Dongiaceae bacterium]